MGARILWKIWSADSAWVAERLVLNRIDEPDFVAFDVETRGRAFERDEHVTAVGGFAPEVAVWPTGCSRLVRSPRSGPSRTRQCRDRIVALDTGVRAARPGALRHQGRSACTGRGLDDEYNQDRKHSSCRIRGRMRSPIDYERALRADPPRARKPAA